MTGSAEEREIRDAVAAFARASLPNVRIVHELVVGGCRADLGAISPDRITLFEIKSEKDTLDRLDNQLKHYRVAAHAVIVVAHIKWFDRTPYDNGSPRLAWHDEPTRVSETWCYPDPGPEISPYGLYKWRFPRPTLEQPRAFAMLDLLWRDELIAEAQTHRIAVGSRTRRPDIMMDMAWLMTGREIAHAVCRQLRARSFPEADPPVFEKARIVEVAA